MRIGGIFRIAACAALALVPGGELVGEFKASAASTRPSEPQVEMICTVTGLPKNRGELTDEAICTRFAQRIREALDLPVKQTGQALADDRARWVRLEVKLLPRGRAEAALTSRLHGKAINHPLLALQVMDKPLGLGDIDRLARLAGKTLAGH